MKIFLIFNFISLFILNHSSAQRVCSSTFEPTQVQQNDSSRYQRFLQLEQHISNYQSSNSNYQNGKLINSNSVIIIPVVVHIIHASNETIGVGANLSVAQIQSQIDVLNEDFTRLNADRVNTPSIFQSSASNR